jgi:hypothetical protein
VALWYCGTVVLWYCGTVVLWYWGTGVLCIPHQRDGCRLAEYPKPKRPVLLCSVLFKKIFGTVLLCYGASSLLWYCSTVVLWYFATVVTVLQWYCGPVVLWY